MLYYTVYYSTAVCRQINLCLAFLEAAFAGCLAWGLANGVVAASPYSYFRLATAVAAVLFVMAVWWKTGQEAAAKGYPVEPSVSSIDWQQATEKRADYQRITSFAVVALNVITSCI
jgi:high-affinity Fe2+/Pb2+ permease